MISESVLLSENKENLLRLLNKAITRIANKMLVAKTPPTEPPRTAALSGDESSGFLTSEKKNTKKTG